jgi:hypothetical protein
MVGKKRGRRKGDRHLFDFRFAFLKTCLSPFLLLPFLLSFKTCLSPFSFLFYPFLKYRLEYSDLGDLVLHLFVLAELRKSINANSVRQSTVVDLATGREKKEAQASYHPQTFFSAAAFFRG